jgi:YfiH family protein
MCPLEEKNISRLSFLTFPFLQKFHIFCGFTSRNSGYSKKPYDSLNLAYHVGDDRDLVRRNRQLVLKNLPGTGKEYLFSARQVHGHNIIYIKKDITHIDGDILEDSDGIMTDQQEVPVMVLGADCMLMLLADIKNRAVCAVHAGWKGTLEMIIVKALGMFQERFGSREDEMYLFIGPGIRNCCYEIGDDLADSFISRFGDRAHLVDKKKKKYLDLAGLNLEQARDFGIPENNILDTGICTSCDSGYFSYRKSRLTGRQAAIAMVY